MKFYAIKGRYTLRFPTNINCIAIFDCCDDVYYYRDLPYNFNGILTLNFVCDGEYYCAIPFEIISIGNIKTDVSEINLPEPERQYFKDVKIVSNYDSNMPACIYPNYNENYALIVTGRKYALSPQPFRVFYLLHELGHLFYSTEKYCDLFAIKYGKSLGYNESQMLYAMTKILNLDSLENQDRIMFIYSILNP